jgi:hypothetical protein
MKRIEIKRSEWLRGTGAGKLKDDRGKKCCLGFVCEAYGVQNMVGCIMPIDLRDEVNYKLLSSAIWLLGEPSSGDVNDAAAINDDIHLFAEEREAKITNLFARHDLEAVFVD